MTGRGKSENPWQAEGKVKIHDRQREKRKPMTGRGKSENLWQAEGKVKTLNIYAGAFRQLIFTFPSQAEGKARSDVAVVHLFGT